MENEEKIEELKREITILKERVSKLENLYLKINLKNGTGAKEFI